ncbi:UDP-N-acetylmuramoyl-L-alanyl-D-glutamate--2,6-diaminopimelate ligase [Rickettsiales endosymbiont of Stachyamoeba lipophora]|uniref:UDP-N-acetylmuramoyl-L-alanyl-D-glutamate--2, 6-diaminopimelate ligase n=1 Tax=Rickettsiales endosymbiont of Stachyamoeba lipophora TaxID=2486578 RepID=UPI000F64C071|nr:UDP-N-acetylmuramoyl-L-alanyl-D-glutamate--2,6-diaminopimelate ligase [Rickettsiales endosymbiont of Stachyamoeba lipophora]
MKVSEITQLINLPTQIIDQDITHITDDSRNVTPSSIFICTARDPIQATKFCQAALKQNAALIITGNDTDLSSPKFNLTNQAQEIYETEDRQAKCSLESNKIIKVSNPYLIKARLAKLFYPTQPEYIYAVTGTNGKTSTAHFTRQLLHLNDLKSASIGTLGMIGDFNNKLEETGLTSPGVIEFSKLLGELVVSNINHLAIEASSHALEQYRIGETNIFSAAFTNFSQDHLDYHLTMQDYFKAKMILFERLLPPKHLAVLNQDIAEFEQIKQICTKKAHQVITFGHKGKDLTIKDIALNQQGISLKAEIFGKSRVFQLPLVGKFQAYNLLTAIGLCYPHINLNTLEEATNQLSSIPGRMEKVNHQKHIFVDYAHKPEALKNILLAAREHHPKKLIVVLGCGGNRDALKRPIMGKIASDYSDIQIITDDNPRFENPAFIRQAIMAACPNGIEIADRAKAIEQAISMASSEDIVVIAGKGHEQYQEINNEKLDFNDIQIATGCM